MLYDKIKSGDKVEIALKLEAGAFSKRYTTKVEVVNSKDEVLIQVPFSLGRLIKLPISDNYTMLFFTKDGMYRFEASINEYRIVDGFKYIVASLLSVGKKVQRRQYFRYNCDMDLKYYKYEDDKLVRDILCNGRVLDLGGGGIRFLSNEPLILDDVIQIVLILNGEFLIADAKILYVDDVIEGIYKYQYRVMFTEILDAEREKIISYVFNEQRKKLNRKG